MRISILLISIYLIGACGSESNEISAEQEHLCEVSEGTVTLHVASSLPDPLWENCDGASGLEAFLVIPGMDSCPLIVRERKVSGCCPGVSLNQNPYVDLYFREASTTQALGMQSKVVYIPEGSEPILDLTFDEVTFDGSVYDSDNDGESNASEFCSGTL